MERLWEFLKKALSSLPVSFFPADEKAFTAYYGATHVYLGTKGARFYHGQL